MGRRKVSGMRRTRAGAVLAGILLLVAACRGDGKGTPDQAAATDSGAARDLAVPDLAPAIDLAPVEDLAEPSDLVRPRDLATVDLTVGDDCLHGAPCPPQTECCAIGRNAGKCTNPACLACCM